MAPILYRSLSRSLFYYPMVWTDSNNIQHEAGYYDEAGNRCDDSTIEKDGTFETTYTCAYCGTQVKVQWKEGQKPNCPNCGAPLEETVEEEETQNGGNLTGMSQKKTTCLGCGIAFVIIILAFLFVAIGSSCSTGKKSGQIFPAGTQSLLLPTSISQSSSSSQNQKLNGQSEIYINELGRSCKWLDDYASYYDKITDCYFWYNDDVDQWQYWYEDISSDYDDYGWMEYDPQDGKWYIEVSDGNWIVLPNVYETKGLWHIE